MITSFTRPTLREVREDIKEALKSVEEKHGIKFTFGSIRFDDSKMNTRLVAHVGTDTSDIAKKEWDEYCTRFGLGLHMFGKSFRSAGDVFTIVGIKPKSPKYPVIAMNNKGMKYKFAADTVIRNLI